MVPECKGTLGVPERETSVRGETGWVQVIEEIHTAVSRVLSSALIIFMSLRATFGMYPGACTHSSTSPQRAASGTEENRAAMDKTAQDLSIGKRPGRCLLLSEVKICLRQTNFV